MMYYIVCYPHYYRYVIVLERKFGKLHSLLPYTSTELCIQGQDSEGIQAEQGRWTVDGAVQECCFWWSSWRSLVDVCLFTGLC